MRFALEFRFKIPGANAKFGRRREENVNQIKESGYEEKSKIKSPLMLVPGMP
jgi:hypothetical protein